ncbi:hypothetical protein QQS21_003676 [Conoideocrella luteorostrata]|uniref:Myb-like DNA-binding domain-containing protein n=1 Tax=Conoideocrella luteorostrata TaxID=1105319 RepID=A0AAJ0CVR4_9HYPO|nr:hypothetical protein QQS21_003676 [Conoideocrella luteorostrata]
MPANQDPSEQVKFLVSCIGNTTNGRPDFNAVAEELSIVSKAAAQKRYERMLKANGVSSSRAATKAVDSDPITPETSPVKRKATPRRALPGSSKKPKMAKGKSVKKEESDEDYSKDDSKDYSKDDSKEDSKAGVKKEEDSDCNLSDPPTSEDGEA